MADNNSPLLSEIQSSKSEPTQLDNTTDDTNIVNSFELSSSNQITLNSNKDEKTLTSDVLMDDCAVSPAKKCCIIDRSSPSEENGRSRSDGSDGNGVCDEVNMSVNFSFDADEKLKSPDCKPHDLSENGASLSEIVSSEEKFVRCDPMPCSVSGEDNDKEEKPLISKVPINDHEVSSAKKSCAIDRSSPSENNDQGKPDGSGDNGVCEEVNMSIDGSFDADEKPKAPGLSENGTSHFDTALAVEKFDSCDKMPCSASEEDNKKAEKSFSSNMSMDDITENPAIKSEGNDWDSPSKASEVQKESKASVSAEDAWGLEGGSVGDNVAIPTKKDEDVDMGTISLATEVKEESKASVSVDDAWGSVSENSAIKEETKAKVLVDDAWGSVAEVAEFKEEAKAKVQVDDAWGSVAEAAEFKEEAKAKVPVEDAWGAAPETAAIKEETRTEVLVDDVWGSASETVEVKNETRAKASFDDAWGSIVVPAEVKREAKAKVQVDDAWGSVDNSWGNSSAIPAKQSGGDDWGSSSGSYETKKETKASSDDTWGSGGSSWENSTASSVKKSGGDDWGSSGSFGTKESNAKTSNDTWGATGGDWGSGGDSGGGSWGNDAGSSSRKSGGSDWGASSGTSERGKSGGKGCFKCGEEGHMSRECPKVGGSRGGGKGCFKCGEEGHMSRECPSGGGSSRGGGKGCFKCGEEGHMSRECPSGGGSSRGGGKGCFKCGEEGHMSRECPSGGGSSRGGGKGCFKCGEEGHMSRECPNGGGGSGSRGGRFEKSEGSSWGSSSWANETKEGPKDNASTGDAWGSGGSSWGNSSSSPVKKSGGGSWGDGAVSPAKKSCTDWGSSSGSNETNAFKSKTSSDDTWGATGGDWGSGGGSGAGTGGGSGGGSWGDSGGSPAKKSGGSDWGASSGGKSGGSGGKGCFKCGEEGHMSRECPKGGGGSGSRGRGCHKCGKEGHMAKDCSEPSLDADGKPKPPIYKPPDLSENDESLFDSASAGENFDSYDAMPCSVSGENVPKDPERYDTFEEAFISETILRGLAQSKIKKPTPIQKYGMRIVMAGRDLMACAQTGSGKTLAFLLPILQDLFSDKDLKSGYGELPAKPRAIIVSPTRELALQIYKEAYKYSRGSIVKAQIIYGGTSVGHQKAKLSEGAHILVGTTGRLLDFLDKGFYDFSELKYLVLDEADRMIDQGFIPDIRKMIIHPTMPPKEKRQTLMFSATFPNVVQEVAAEFLVSNYLFLTVGILGAANSDVEQTLLKVEKFGKRNKLVEILKESSNNDRTMIFVESKKTADFLASFLSQSDYKATSIHGDRYQRQREEALADLKSGKFPILVATSVASRGLDIKDVRHVINYDLPKEIDDYIHRIGRTGRVGNKGKATSFYDPAADKALAAKIIEVIKNASQTVPDWLNEEVSEGEFGNGIAFGAVDFRNEGGSDAYQDLDAPKQQSSSLDLEW